MIKVTCSEGCGEEFIILSLGREPIQRGIERVGFSCPHCGQVYTSYYANHKINELNAKLSELQQRPGQVPMNQRQIASLETQISNVKKRLALEMSNLRKKMESNS